MDMATVFKNSNSSYWKARWINTQGKRVSRSTKTESKREAKKIAEQFEAEERANSKESMNLSAAYGKILQRVIREAEAGRLTLLSTEGYIREIHKIANPDYEEVSLESYWSKWIEEQRDHVTTSTFNGYKQDRDVILEALGVSVMKANITTITTEQIQKALKKAHTPKRKASTVNKALSCLRRVMESAVDAGLATKNPAKKARPLKQDDSENRAPFTPEEVLKMIELKDISDEWKGAILLASTSGMRCGDVTKISRDDIRDDSATFMPEKTARTKKIISIPLSKDFLDWLGDRKGDLFPTLRKQQKSTTSMQFRSIMKRAGVPNRIRGAGGQEYIRSFHSSRHSFTSWLAEAGVSAEIRQSITGHSSSSIHQNYTHFDSARVEAIKKLPSLKTKD